MERYQSESAAKIAKGPSAEVATPDTSAKPIPLVKTSVPRYTFLDVSEVDMERCRPLTIILAAHSIHTIHT